ncbi:MAG: indolepyruvate oxidoreductase subunit beta [Firmicutes bacterium]|nr:indolepyruvate oxidoreductase subunit beta [Bacillota bacterium]
MIKNIVLCGVGGQGTVLASRLISAAAMKKEWPSMSAETIGMGQRGGSVFSHLRIAMDGETLNGPMIAPESADLILGFEPGETVRMLPYLGPDGQVVVSDRAVQPVTATLSGSDYRAQTMLDFLKETVPEGKLHVVPASKALEDVGSSKVLNLILLGAACGSGALGFTEQDIKEVILEHIKPQFHELNFSALEYGMRLIKKS